MRGKKQKDAIADLILHKANLNLRTLVKPLLFIPDVLVSIHYLFQKR
jgi:hypothetical protein